MSTEVVDGVKRGARLHDGGARQDGAYVLLSLAYEYTTKKSIYP